MSITYYTSIHGYKNHVNIINKLSTLNQYSAYFDNIAIIATMSEVLLVPPFLKIFNLGYKQHDDIGCNSNTLLVFQR
ncbi:MAG: hypothetical protein ACI89T_001308 [Cognaticolwellia sp.]|jgi:hypothetical protein